MKFKRHMKLEHGLKQIDIAPLIDVVLLMLLFFMLTSVFVIQPGIKINLPKAVTSQAVKFQNVEIVISAENVIYYNDKVVTLQELKKIFQQVNADNCSVLIKADRRASLGRIVEIWDLLRGFGLAQVNIATDQE